MFYDPCFASTFLPFLIQVYAKKRRRREKKNISKLIKVELNVYFKSVIAGDESAALKMFYEFIYTLSRVYQGRVRGYKVSNGNMSPFDLFPLAEFSDYVDSLEGKSIFFM